MLDSCSPDFGHKVKKKDKSRETTEFVRMYFTNQEMGQLKGIHKGFLKKKKEEGGGGGEGGEREEKDEE